MERWAIKTGGDAEAGGVNATPTATTIDSLVSVQVPVGATSSSTRVAPIETSTYILDGTLINYRLTEDSDYHLVLRSSIGTTMIVEAPHPDCVSSSSPFLNQIKAVRAAVDATIAPTPSFKSSSILVRTTGIGFFDGIHDQLGVAANGIELHPLTSLTFNPSMPLPVPVLGTYTGLWWNQNESGWGMSITQHGSMIFNAFYTYDQAGQPTWYAMSSCPLSGKICTGEIYQVTGGTPPIQPWNGANKVVSSVGSGTLSFADVNNGTFTFAIDGVAGSKSITRQVFATGITQATLNYSDLWWNPNESGWGVALTQQYGMIFAAWYGYDSSGNAIWYVASSCPVAGSGCMGDLYQVTGGSSLTSVWNGANKTVAKVGTIAFDFTDASNGTMSYTINGVAGSRAITRQGF